ncbi:hypothetical protein EV426DRAFT_670526 [Tirmania nivea]|nr:hypothetical protein EV426DRAFT_670526 [Tirmania nivea]
MSFGFGVGNFIAVSKLALRVYTAYKSAPDDFRNIFDEINSLHNVVNIAQSQFEGSNPDPENQKKLKEVLQGCKNVLKDLDELHVKYGAMASNASQGGLAVGRAVDRVKWGQENIIELRARLTSNTTLLNTFISS